MAFTDRYGTMVESGTSRYKAAARWFHWLTAALMVVIIPLGWIFAEFKTNQAKTAFEAPFPGSPLDYSIVHKSLGLIVFALVLCRLAYRVANRPPALPSRTPKLEIGLAHATHWLLYLVLLVMPISGYIMSSAGDHPISFLGLFDVPKLPISKDQGKIASGIHVFTQFAVYALITLHLASVAWHVFSRRDGVLDRMLPAQRRAD